MDLFLQLTLNGLIVGAIYAMIAIGLTLVFGVSNIKNLAHGDFFMCGSYVLFTVFAVAHSYILASIAAVISVAVLSYLSERILFRRLIQRSSSVAMVLSGAFGLSLVLQHSVLAIWGSTPQVVNTSLSAARLKIGSISTTWQRLLVLVVACVLFYLLYIFLHKTKYGKSIRAVAQNREAAESLGIDPIKVEVLVFVIAGILAGCSSFLVAPITTLSPYMGIMFTFKGIVITILGGLGQVGGAIIAALGLGLVESYVIGYIDPGLQYALPFLFLVLVILVKPRGLFGGKGSAL